MQNLFLFFKGLIVGIGKIIPGVSGSMLAALFGIYENSIYAINHLKDDYKKSISYLFPIGLGVILSIVLFSKILLYFLNYHYLFTMFFFLGLILGTVPKFRLQFTLKKKYDKLLCLLGFCLPFSFSFLGVTQEFVPNGSILSYCFLFVLGFIDALSMVIPGISGTAIFMMLGSYTTILTLFQNPFSQLDWSCFFGFGVVIGIFVSSFFIEYVIQKNKNSFLVFVYGLLWSSIVYLFSMVIFQVNISTLLPVVFILFIGFLLSNIFS